MTEAEKRTRFRILTLAVALLVPLLALAIPPLGNLVLELLLEAAHGFLYLAGAC